jgi:hypothetical protein
MIETPQVVGIPAQGSAEDYRRHEEALASEEGSRRGSSGEVSAAKAAKELARP